MSFTHLCLSLLALSPQLSASLLSGLVAAVPVLAGQTDRAFREAVLTEQMNRMHPRDLEEAMLASQFLTAFHNGEACFRALDGLDPASKEASRLRRDGLAMMRSAIATQRALHRSQARPMLQDAEGGEPRPTVPVRLATPPRGRAAGKESTLIAANQPGSRQPAAAPARDGARSNPINVDLDAIITDPSLLRLCKNWPPKPWEEMTMEERRETFGYNYEPKRPAASTGDGGSAAALSG